MKQVKLWFPFSVVSVVLFFNCTEAISRQSSITLENNEFKNILVAIHDNVADDPSLVQTIKDTFTKASAFLYAGTQQRAVFRDVTILVPSAWSNSNNAYGGATSEVFNNADIIFTAPVSPAPPASATRGRRSVDSTSSTSSRPHPPAMTKSYAGCGHQGVRIILTTDVLTDRRLANTMGPPEKIIVHEWAHFRWGVFDEYALDGEPQFYFSPSTGNLEGIRCTEMISGIISRPNPVTGRPEYCRDLDPATGLYPAGCSFMPYPAGPLTVGIEASIMDHLSVRPISKFCNDDTSHNATKHNYDAPSRHNRLCGHRSTWDVISSSADFNDGANAPRAGMDTAPVFNVVQAGTSRRLMLALDTSQSMAGDEKMTRMKHAVATFVQEGVAPATEVGLTTFSTEAHLRRAPQRLNTSHDRQSFADDLPDTQDGVTDITLALTSAAKTLQGHYRLPSSTQSTGVTDSYLPPDPLTTLGRNDDGHVIAFDQDGSDQMTTSAYGIAGQKASSGHDVNDHVTTSGHVRSDQRKTSGHDGGGQTTTSGHDGGGQTTTSGQDDGSQTSTSGHDIGGHVVVVTDGQETSGRKLRSAVPVLRAARVAVSFVVLGGPPGRDLEHVALKTGGRVYCDSNLHSSTTATDAFFDILQHTSSSPSLSPVQVMTWADGLSRDQSVEGHFSLDAGLGQLTSIIAAYGASVPTVSVRAPSGRVYSHIYPEYTLDQRTQMARITIPGKAETGKWSYTVTNPGSSQRVSLLIVSSPANVTVEPVRVSGTLTMWKRASPTTMHIFAEAARGSQPVTGLGVSALITTPTGSSVKMELMDNGAGADIVENDGVYSRAFSKLTTPGLYTVRLAFSGHHGGDMQPDTETIHPGDVFVERSVSAGYIVVEPSRNSTSAHAHTHAQDNNGSDDNEAPVRISDLRVVKTFSTNRTVMLSWRASGDDGDSSTASRYEVFMAPSAYDLMQSTSHVTNVTQSDVIHGSLTSPKPFGTREFYMLQIPAQAALSSKGGFVFTVVAVDEAGNRGQHSNYVTVGLGRVPDVTDSRYWGDGSQFQAATTQLDAPHDERVVIAGVLGTNGALFVIGLVSVLIVAFFCKSKKDNEVLPTSFEHPIHKAKADIFALTKI